MKTKGFTLIESLVALVILSTVFAFVWEWFGTAVISTRKIESAVELPIIYDQALDYLELQNFEDKKEGTIKINNYSIEWQAEPIRSSVTEAYRKQDAWIVTLFNVQLTIKKTGQTVTQIETKLVKQWRDSSYVPTQNLL